MLLLVLLVLKVVTLPRVRPTTLTLSFACFEGGIKSTERTCSLLVLLVLKLGYLMFAPFWPKLLLVLLVLKEVGTCLYH